MNHILTRNYVQVTGNGSKPMIFAPGFGCDQTVWSSVTKEFEDHYRIISFDYVGSGNSDINAYDPIKYSTLEGYAQDVLDVCEALHVKDAVFVGHSVGSMIGMLASIQRPDYFSNLIMIGPSPCYLNDAPHYTGGFEKEDLLGLVEMMEKNYIGWASMFAPTVMGNLERPDLSKDLESRFCSTDPVIARQFAQATFFADNRDDLKKVSVPTLILQCSNDIIAPLAVGDYVHQQIKDSTLTLMQASGHCPHMSHPVETVQCIRDYFKSE